MHRFRTPCFSSLVLAAALMGCSEDLQTEPFAKASRIQGLDEVIGGPMALARPKDFRLENEYFRVGILSGRHSMGPGLYGGSLVDADLQWNDASVDGGQGRDQWNEMFPLASMNVPFADGDQTVFIEKDGADGGEAVIRVASPATPFLSLLDLLWGLVSMPDMWLVTDYIAEPGVPWLTVRTTVTFQETPEPVVDGVEMAYPQGSLDVITEGLTEGVVMGDFFLAGGSVDVFAPGIGFDEDGEVFRANKAGRNSFADPFEFPFVAATGDGISYGIATRGSMFVPLFTASQTAVVGASQTRTTPVGPRFAPNDAFSYERWFFIGHGDVGSIVDQYLQAREIPSGTVSGTVFEQGSTAPMSGIDVFVYEPGAEFPWSQWRTDVRPDDTLLDGSFSGQLPVGTWELMVHQEGRPDSARIPVEVTEGGEVRVRMEAPRAGVFSFRIVDETGRLVPAKLSIFDADPGAETSRQPALGDGFVAGDPEWVVFADTGMGEVALPPGEYYAVASRGLEYEIDVSDPFVIDAARAYDTELQVFRSIETDGWVSADFHVHSNPSHDSGVTLRNRVRSMVCEGVEFFSSTDHDFLTDFAPVVEDMGHEEWVQTAVGVETTTVEIGHFLGFPMRQRFLGDVGGAQDWTGLTPTEILDNLRQQGKEAGYDPMVFVAHPRDGILGYLDQYGMDPFAGTPAVGDAPPQASFPPSLFAGSNPLLAAGNATLDFDALELFTGKRLDTHRTPTKPELDGFASDDGTDLYDWITRTMEEQEALSADTYRLTGDLEGTIDDWFTLLNLGYRHTAIGNSDTHGMTSIEAGCPRNFVMASTDDPAFLDDQEMADAVKEHRVVASYGPFLRMWVDGADIGSDVEAEGPIRIQLEVQAPSWIDVDRVELYENGTLIREFEVPAGGDSNLRFYEEIEHTPTKDSWYVAIAAGDGTLAPVFTEVEIPYIPLDEAVTGALGAIAVVGSVLGEPTPFPKEYPIHPYAVTNPVWVDVDGGGFQAPGLPVWLQPAADE